MSGYFQSSRSGQGSDCAFLMKTPRIARQILLFITFVLAGYLAEPAPVQGAEIA